MSALVRCAVLGCVLALFSASARAQTCHAPSLRQTDETNLRLELQTLAARYESTLYVGRYQGVGVAVGMGWKRLAVDASLTAYRIERNGLIEYGLGDTMLGLRVSGLERSFGQHTLRFGPEVSLMAPSGDAARGLGMGHVMVGGGLFASLSGARHRIIAQLDYARSFTSGGEHAAHAGGQGALVNPMNASELQHALSGAYDVLDWLSLSLRLSGAQPIASDPGKTREVLTPGLSFVWGIVDVGFAQEVPLWGAPFAYRSTLHVGFQW